MAHGTFTVTTVHIGVAPTTGVAGSGYTVTGSGFSVSSSATVSFNGVAQTPTGCTDGSFASTTITTDGTGGFVCTFNVPTIVRATTTS